LLNEIVTWKEPLVEICEMLPLWNPKQIRKTPAINSFLASYVSTYNKESSHSLESIKHMETYNPLVFKIN